MAIEGPLRELGIHDVFQLLDLSRKTGVLRVTSELRHNAGTVYFDGGTIIFAEIRTNPHPLGALLLRTGKITEADLERGRDMQQRQGDKRRIGEILVALGAITPRELERQVRFQIEEVVFEMMSWREGYFSFTEGPLTDVATDATVRIPTEALLMEGARRIDEWSRIEGRIPHLGVVPTLGALGERAGRARLAAAGVGDAGDGGRPARFAHHRLGAGALGFRGGEDAVRARERRARGAGRPRHRETRAQHDHVRSGRARGAGRRRARAPGARAGARARGAGGRCPAARSHGAPA